MSTTALIARPTGRGRYEGVELSQDGRPLHAGATLHRRCLEEFTLRWLDRARLHFTGGDHPMGWRGLGESVETDRCFCHEDNPEQWPYVPVYTQEHAAQFDWVYVIRHSGLRVMHRDRPTFDESVVLPWVPISDAEWELVERKARTGTHRTR